MRTATRTVTALLILVCTVPRAHAQGGPHYGGPGYHPDSLSTVTVTGTVRLDQTAGVDRYYLDADGDGGTDYRLHFGPPWYVPVEEAAARPAAGATVSVTGGLRDDALGGPPVLVVFEIDGHLWREPYGPYWAQMDGAHHAGGCGGYAFGWAAEPAETVTLDGTVVTDTTFVFTHYYLDVDGDGTPDYFLNFGPPWYAPATGAERPADGAAVTVTGPALDTGMGPTIVVDSLDGTAWRPDGVLGPHLGGAWMRRGMTEARRFHAPFDEATWVEMSPGWHGGRGHHGGMMSDSLFGRMLELFPENIPNAGGMGAFAGWEVGLFQPDGRNGMQQGGMCGGHFTFTTPARHRLHYTDAQLAARGVDEATVTARYWDGDVEAWVHVADAVVDAEANTVTFSSETVPQFVILTGEAVGTARDETAAPPEGFALRQNYPNPFNPTTTITFDVEAAALVRLSVYDALGRRVATLAEGRRTPGIHRVVFDARGLPAGTYFYRLTVNGQTASRQMTLLK